MKLDELDWSDYYVKVNYGLKLILFLTQSYHMASEFLEYSAQVYCVLLLCLLLLGFFLGGGGVVWIKILNDIKCFAPKKVMSVYNNIIGWVNNHRMKILGWNTEIEVKSEDSFHSVRLYYYMGQICVCVFWGLIACRCADWPCNHCRCCSHFGQVDLAELMPFH